MHLVRRAMAQPLVVARTHEDTRLHLATRETVVENLIAMRLHSQVIAHDLSDPLQRDLIEG